MHSAFSPAATTPTLVVVAQRHTDGLLAYSPLSQICSAPADKPVGQVLADDKPGGWHLADSTLDWNVFWPTIPRLPPLGTSFGRRLPCINTPAFPSPPPLASVSLSPLLLAYIVNSQAFNCSISFSRSFSMATSFLGFSKSIASSIALPFLRTWFEPVAPPPDNVRTLEASISRTEQLGSSPVVVVLPHPSVTSSDNHGIYIVKALWDMACFDAWLVDLLYRRKTRTALFLTSSAHAAPPTSVAELEDEIIHLDIRGNKVTPSAAREPTTISKPRTRYEFATPVIRKSNPLKSTPLNRPKPARQPKPESAYYRYVRMGPYAFQIDVRGPVLPPAVEEPVEVAQPKQPETPREPVTPLPDVDDQGRCKGTFDWWEARLQEALDIAESRAQPPADDWIPPWGL